MAGWRRAPRRRGPAPRAPASRAPAVPPGSACPRRHHRAGADLRAALDHGAVEHAGADTDERAVLDRAAVEHGGMADHHVGADEQRVGLVRHVQHGAVLHVRPRPDADEVDVAAHDGVEPERGVVADLDVARQLGRGGQEDALAEPRADALVGVEGHGANPRAARRQDARAYHRARRPKGRDGAAAARVQGPPRSGTGAFAAASETSASQRTTTRLDGGDQHQHAREQHQRRRELLVGERRDAVDPRRQLVGGVLRPVGDQQPDADRLVRQQRHAEVDQRPGTILQTLLRPRAEHRPPEREAADQPAEVQRQRAELRSHQRVDDRPAGGR